MPRALAMFPMALPSFAQRDLPPLDAVSRHAGVGGLLSAFATSDTLRL